MLIGTKGESQQRYRLKKQWNKEKLKCFPTPPINYDNLNPIERIYVAQGPTMESTVFQIYLIIHVLIPFLI